ncbi:MAG TPA: response regulator transcription factor [Dehalococcoidia bacterium]|nr:response regulator transcription factor [Dehalococcoidia bacterium]
MDKIKVCVIVPFEPLRTGLASTIARAPDMEVIDELEGLTALPGRAAFREAHVLVVDSDGLLGARRPTYDQLDRWLPQLKVLFLGTREDARNLTPDDLPAYMRLDTVGFIFKDGPAERLLEAIRLVNASTFVCETGLIRHILTRLSQWATYSDDNSGSQLSEREMEVLTLVTQGASNKAIAQELFLSEGTVKAHVSHVMGKLGVERRTDLVRYALTRGLVKPAEDGSNAG